MCRHSQVYLRVFEFVAVICLVLIFKIGSHVAQASLIFSVGLRLELLTLLQTPHI